MAIWIQALGDAVAAAEQRARTEENDDSLKIQYNSPQ
jgi:hypothetical protein